MDTPDQTDYDENLVPDPQDLEALIINLEDDEEFRITEKEIQGKRVTTYTYDSGSGVGFDLISLAGESWLYLPFDEDFDDFMILREELQKLVGPDYSPYLEGYDFNLLDDNCGPGSVLIFDSESLTEWWSILALDEGYTLAHRIVKEHG